MGGVILGWLDRTVGPLRVRAWLLVANMGANALALYGLSLLMREGEGQFIFACGMAMSVLCIAITAVPTAPSDAEPEDAATPES